MKNTPLKYKFREPYSELAGIYDSVMDHVNYRQWSNYLHSVFTEFAQIPVKEVLELASGTGSFAIDLSEMEYNVSALDINFEMLKIAREKSVRKGSSINFWLGDIRRFRTRKHFDAIICMYDSINYLNSTNEIQDTFDCVSEILNAGGLFVFDICTEKNSQKHFNNVYNRNRELGYSRESFYRERSRIQINQFKIETNSEIYFEVHRQHIFRVNELQEAIRASQLEMIHIFDNLTFNLGSEDSERVHFVLKKID